MGNQWNTHAHQHVPVPLSAISRGTGEGEYETRYRLSPPASMSSTPSGTFESKHGQ